MILPRQFLYGNYKYNNDGNCNSAWDRWGRWVLLAVILVAAFLIFFCFSCFSARRRRKSGYAPYRGTGWVLGGHGPVTYNNTQPHYANGAPTPAPYYNNSNNPAPPPAYTPPPNNTYYGNNAGIELQQPGATYQGYNREVEEQYAPPKDPPPRK